MTVQIGTTEHKQGHPEWRERTQRVCGEALSLQRCGALGEVPSCLPWPSILHNPAMEKRGRNLTKCSSRSCWKLPHPS